MKQFSLLQEQLPNEKKGTHPYNNDITLMQESKLG
jgi:hypothetical protein